MNVTVAIVVNVTMANVFVANVTMATIANVLLWEELCVSLVYVCECECVYVRERA